MDSAALLGDVAGIKIRQSTALDARVRKAYRSLSERGSTHTERSTNWCIHDRNYEWDGGSVVRSLIRLLRRLAILGLGILTVWLIVFVFRFTDRRLPWVLALAVTYGIAAYVILPRAVRMGLKVLQRKRVPSFTITGDGLPGDPVNLLLTGTPKQLHAAFKLAGWSEADRLGLASSWRMVRAFLLKSPYPTAPFSTLYLFGRRQDVGFQRAIDNSPRKRHHVRFWALSLTHAEANLGETSFWLNTDRPPDEACVHWVGAATKDTGISLTRLTFQITHATDSDTNAERDHIIGVLKNNGAIAEISSYKAGQHLASERVNHYVTDGEVIAAKLMVKSDTEETFP
jgi:hypothetical protein